MKITGKRLSMTMAIGALALGAFAGYASANQNEPEKEAAPAQAAAKTVQLTSAQRADLDKQVDGVLSRTTGGERVGVNQISWDNGDVVMTIPLPGEKIARANGERVDAKSACSSGSSCLYADQNFGGRKVSFSTCKFQKLRNYDFTNKTSSWHNNQTGGANSRLYYWANNETNALVSTWAVSKINYMGAVINDKADFIRVC